MSIAGPRPTPPDPEALAEGVSSPMEPHSGYRGADWTPERLMFHQNLESFAERVGLVVGLQSRYLKSAFIKKCSEKNLVMKYPITYLTILSRVLLFLLVGPRFGNLSIGRRTRSHRCS